MHRLPTLLLHTATLLASGLSVTVNAALRDDVGWTALAAELGGAMPTGAGVEVLQVEMASGGGFAPDAANPALTGRSFSYGSWTYTATPPSRHATSVAGTWYGNTSGVAPGVSTIRVFEAWYYAYESAKMRTTQPPQSASWRIENHSWIGESAFGAVEALRRVDFRAARDNVLVVAGLNNGSGTSVPTFFGHLYNGLVVGVSSGSHSRGGTVVDGAGRSKPDLVAPAGATSYAAPVVSGAAALLLEIADGNAALAAAGRIEVLKAILLAGTTRDEFPLWSHTVDRPLDPTWGAGELNVQRSVEILSAGPRDPSAANTRLSHGWHPGTSTAPDAAHLFEIVETPLQELVVALTWNRTVTHSPDMGTWDASLADLDMELWRLDSTSLVAESKSALDNVELLVLRNLSPGRYALVVSSDAPAVSYGLAWYAEPATAPAAPAVPVGLTLLAQ